MSNLFFQFASRSVPTDRSVRFRANRSVPADRANNCYITNHVLQIVYSTDMPMERWYGMGWYGMVLVDPRKVL